jgi:hypothetical protein
VGAVGKEPRIAVCPIRTEINFRLKYINTERLLGTKGVEGNKQHVPSTTADSKLSSLSPNHR